MSYARLKYKCIKTARASTAGARACMGVNVATTNTNNGTNAESGRARIAGAINNGHANGRPCAQATRIASMGDNGDGECFQQMAQNIIECRSRARIITHVDNVARRAANEASAHGCA